MATGVAFLGVALGALQARKSSKETRKAGKIQGKRADIENARARRQSVAAARRARAATIAQGVSGGISGGSQVAGAAGSVQTQGASNVSFLQQLESLDAARFSALDNANRFSTRSNIAQGVAGVAAGPIGSEVESFFRQP